MVVAVIICLTGCGRNDADTRSAPKSVEALTPSSSADPAALTRVDTLLARRVTAEETRQKAVDACLRKAGKSWGAVEIPQMTARDLVQTPVLTVEEARISGYAPVGDSGSAGPGPVYSQEMIDLAAAPEFVGRPENGIVKAEVLDYSAVLAKDGCYAESLAAVYGSTENGLKATTVLDQILSTTASMALGQSDFPADENWAECMEKAGVSGLSSPSELRDQVMLGKRPATVNLPVKDAQCRQSVGYEAAVSQRLAGQLTSLFSTFGTEMEELEGIIAKGVGKA
jgi:hypothetical protein